MKQTIKLNESQLREIIEESVQQVLSELDWKSYANAAKKREEQGKKDKSSVLLKHATDTIKKKYPNRHYYASHYPGGVDKYNAYSDYEEEGWFDPYLATKYGYLNYGETANGGAVWPPYSSKGELHKSFGDKGVKSWGKGTIDGERYHDRYTPNEPNEIPTPNDKWQAGTYKGSKQGDWDTPTDNPMEWDWNEMSDDMENYYTKNYKYAKGKGWHLKNK